MKRARKRPAGQLALSILSVALYFVGLVLLLTIPLYSFPSAFLSLGAVLLAVAITLGTEALVFLFCLLWRGMSVKEYAERANSLPSADRGEEKKRTGYPKVEGTLLLKGTFFLVALVLSILFLCLVPSSFRWANSLSSNVFAGIGEGGAALLALFGCAALTGGVGNSWSLMAKVDRKRGEEKASADTPKE